jgi:hypothetical protein
MTWRQYEGGGDPDPLSAAQVDQGARATIAALSRRANRVLVHDVHTPDDAELIDRIDLMITHELPGTIPRRHAGVRRVRPSEVDGSKLTALLRDDGERSRG